MRTPPPLCWLLASMQGFQVRRGEEGATAAHAGLLSGALPLDLAGADPNLLAAAAAAACSGAMAALAGSAAAAAAAAQQQVGARGEHRSCSVHGLQVCARAGK